MDAYIWECAAWEREYSDDTAFRRGLRLECEVGVEPEVRRACKAYSAWLRTQFCFPLRVPVYLKAAKALQTRDGEGAVATFFEPFSRKEEPYIRLATGDYHELSRAASKDDALAAILLSLTHELTHYFIWINNLTFSDDEAERIADEHARYLLYEYSKAVRRP